MTGNSRRPAPSPSPAERGEREQGVGGAAEQVTVRLVGRRRCASARPVVQLEQRRRATSAARRRRSRSRPRPATASSAGLLPNEGQRKPVGRRPVSRLDGVGGLPQVLLDGTVGRAASSARCSWLWLAISCPAAARARDRPPGPPRAWPSRPTTNTVMRRPRSARRGSSRSTASGSTLGARPSRARPGSAGTPRRRPGRGSAWRTAETVAVTAAPPTSDGRRPIRSHSRPTTSVDSATLEFQAVTRGRPARWSPAAPGCPPCRCRA